MDTVMRTAIGAPLEGAESMPILEAAKLEYRALCETEPSIPIFSTDWWLDAAVGAENWEVVLVKTNGRIVGAMPLPIERRFGMKLIHQPPLTPFLGPWILPISGKTSARLGTEQKILRQLIEQLPRFDSFRQSLDKGVSNWLPFYWHGFTQTTEYTYVLHRLDDLDVVWKQFESARRKHCRDGAERFKVRQDVPVDDFLALHKMTLENRGVYQSFSDECLRRIDTACAARNRRKIHVIVDDAGRYCAGTYTIWDGNCAYALLKGSNPKGEYASAPSLCQWEAIKFSSTKARKYDFLGNMNPSIEPYVRSFGTEQTPVFTISKTPSRLLRLRQGMKSFLASSR